jgi:RhtB (resistance to homoserine/threonine) family protein
LADLHSILTGLLAVAIVHQLAVMSPGPDFAIVTKNSLAHSRRIGISTALGVALGILVHVGYSLLGIGFLIARSVVLYSTIKYIGAAYLILIGWKALRSRGMVGISTETDCPGTLTAWQAFVNGLLCNILNPKATLFIFALFTQVIDPSTPLSVQIFYGAYTGVATFLWFSAVASLFSLAAIRRLLQRWQRVIERTMGVVLIALGFRIALSQRE